jgi:hypothetical protein
MDQLVDEIVQNCPNYNEMLRKHVVFPLIQVLYSEFRLFLFVGGTLVLVNFIMIIVTIYMLATSKT